MKNGPLLSAGLPIVWNNAAGTVTVAVHAGRDVSLRTVRSILAQAGLTGDELKELL